MNRRRRGLATPSRPRPPTSALSRSAPPTADLASRIAREDDQLRDLPSQANRRTQCQDDTLGTPRGSRSAPSPYGCRRCRERVAAPDEGCRPASAPPRAHCRAGDAPELRGSRGSDRLGGVIGPRATAETRYPRKGGARSAAAGCTRRTQRGRSWYDCSIRARSLTRGAATIALSLRNAQRTSLWETRLLENRSEGQSGGGSVDFPSIDKPSVDTRAGGEGTDAELGLGVSRYDR